MLGPEVPQRVEDLSLPAQILRFSRKQEGESIITRFSVYDLGMGCDDDLRVVLGGDLTQQGVDLLLTKNLEVGVRLVDQQDAAGVRVDVCEDEEHLLKAAAGEGDFERLPYFGLPVVERDAASHRFGGIVKVDRKQAIHQPHDTSPCVRVVAVHHEAEVAEHLGSLSLAEEHIDPTRLQQRFLDIDSGHRVQQPHVDPGGGLNGTQVRQRRFVRRAIDHFRTRVAEAHRDGTDGALVQHTECDLHHDVRAPGPNHGVMPEVARERHGHGDDAQPV